MMIYSTHGSKACAGLGLSACGMEESGVGGESSPRDVRAVRLLGGWRGRVVQVVRGQHTVVRREWQASR